TDFVRQWLNYQQLGIGELIQTLYEYAGNDQNDETELADDLWSLVADASRAFRLTPGQVGHFYDRVALYLTRRQALQGYCGYANYETGEDLFRAVTGFDAVGGVQINIRTASLQLICYDIRDFAAGAQGVTYDALPTDTKRRMQYTHGVAPDRNQVQRLRGAVVFINADAIAEHSQDSVIADIPTDHEHSTALASFRSFDVTSAGRTWRVKQLGGDHVMDDWLHFELGGLGGNNLQPYRFHVNSDGLLVQPNGST